VSVLEFHRQLRDVAEDQLSLAAVHYLRAHYQEAIDIYKRLVLQNKELMALHVCNTNSFNIRKSNRH
jgi:intraflagellar transport protein 56